VRRRHIFRRLADQNECAPPAVLELREHPRDPDQRSHVEIMAAGVHDGNFIAGVVLGDHGAGIGQAGLFLDWQRVHVGADQHRRATAVS
jgi:hypothetical protein